jgi:hypothetical protein
MRRLLALSFVCVVSLLASNSAMGFTWLDVGGTPVVTVPSDITAEATSSAGAAVTFTATATDAEDGTVPVTCNPASGTTFTITTAVVTCAATDVDGNTGSGTFNVTVQDTTAPSLGQPADITTTTNVASGTIVSWLPVSANDIVDGSLTATCSPPSGSSFQLGGTTVTCTATDGHGNSDQKNFTVTVTFDDITKPTFTSVPGTINADATVPGGATVTYSVSATDDSGAPPTVVCNPGSGSTFPVGTTTVHCTATDAKGNSENAQFDVVVVLVDHTAPVLSGVPANKAVEANGPGGSVVNYPTPTANDNLDGLIAAVTCSPVSGSLFPLGGTTVTCTATDTHGNSGTAAFTISVDDTTPPAIYLPTAASIVAKSALGIASSDPVAQAYFQAVRVLDMIDPHPVVTYESASQLSIGPNLVTFRARDAGGNESVKTATLTVLALGSPTPPTPKPPTPPAEVKNVTVTPLDGAARIRWDAGGRQVIVTRSSSSARSLAALNDEVVVYTGTSSSYVDRGLQNGVEYRYVVSAVDAAGNHSAGVAAVIVPRRNLLKSPKDGAKLRKAPKLIWAVDSEAQYYNAQLLLDGKKILSVWPLHPAYVLKKSWKYEGRTYTLKPGIYSWFVWPGYGARSAVDYGEMMGSRTFRIVR